MSVLSSALPTPDPATLAQHCGCVRPPVAEARRIVVKLGTRVLTEENGSIAVGRVSALLATVAALRQSGREVMVVMSGAVGVGRAILGLPVVPRAGAMRQACAAVGQARMTDVYRRAFAGLGVLSAQVLVAQGDFDDRGRSIRLREALEALLCRGVVPVLNENDAVARERLRASGEVIFDDNDRLAALVASTVAADLLTLLTDVEGVFERAPRRDAKARPLARIDGPSVSIEAGGTGSPAGRGGMRAKLAAAEIACRSGCHVVIASGCSPGAFSHVVAGEDRGTWFPPHDRIEAHRRWIAFASVVRGALILDAGAVEALCERGSSLLAAGVTGVEGDWAAGDVLELRDSDGRVVGRARCRLGAAAVRRACRGRRPARRRSDTLIRRDAIVLDA